MDPWPEVAAARFLVGVLLAVLLARAAASRSGSPIAGPRGAGRSSARSPALCTFYALTSPRIHLADAVTLGATAPIFVALLAPWFLGEPRSRSVGVAVLIAFAGVALVLQPRFQRRALGRGDRDPRRPALRLRHDAAAPARCR